MKFSDSFHIMTKPSGAICNMDCTYCYYLQKENLYEGQKDFRMNDEVLESFIKQYIQVQKIPEISFAWQGGEPTLLGVDYFKKVVELQDKYGECPKHRFIETSDGENGLNYLCEGYYHFFNHVDPYMKFMSEQLKIKQPPANVIEWAKEKDEGFPSLDVRRNDVCPCGSGKKYKKCCGEMIKT